jgi:hypothetical protein
MAFDQRWSDRHPIAGVELTVRLAGVLAELLNDSMNHLLIFMLEGLALEIPPNTS